MKRKGTVVSVNYSIEKGVVKIPIEKGIFEENFGLVGDAHGGPHHRQVSLLGVESIQKMDAQSGLPYGSFAENLTTEGICLYTLPVGTVLRIGETLQEVTQIGKKCHTGCAISQTVGKCIMPHEGVFTKVLQGGRIQVEDIIEIWEKEGD